MLVYLFFLGRGEGEGGDELSAVLVTPSEALSRVDLEESGVYEMDC